MGLMASSDSQWWCCPRAGVEQCQRVPEYAPMLPHRSSDSKPMYLRFSDQRLHILHLLQDSAVATASGATSHVVAWA